MTLTITPLLRFAGRNWLRIIIIATAMFMISRKQINFNIRLGTPQELPVPAAVPPSMSTEDQSLLSEKESSKDERSIYDRLGLWFSSDEATMYDKLSLQDEAVIKAFIRRFQNVAQAEQEKFGIPASITLANALLFSQAGQANSVSQLVNYFAIPCTSEWKGEVGRSSGICMRKYTTAWSSFRDHSLYITSGKYEALRLFNNKDYMSWSSGLEELDYKDMPDLASQLQKTIDRWQLFQFD